MNRCGDFAGAKCPNLAAAVVDRDVLAGQLTQTRAALAFYADERRYEVDEDGCAIRWEEYEGDPILQDSGHVARAALVSGGDGRR